MKGCLVIVVCFVCLCFAACKADAGELSPVQKCDTTCVQKEFSPVQKCPVQKCDTICVPVTYRMTLCSRIRLRRAAIREAREIRIQTRCVSVRVGCCN